MNAVTYVYLLGGRVRLSGMYHSCLTDAQVVAADLLAAPVGQDCDEVRVWMGPTDVGDPHAVARRDGAR